MRPGSVWVQYAKPWSHSDIKSCRQSILMYSLPGMILLYLAMPFYTEGVFG